jgi:uncharacterized protein
VRSAVGRHLVPVTIGLVIATLFVATRAARLWTDVLWFDSLGYTRVFWQLLGTQAALGVVAAVVVGVLVGGNVALARRLAPTFQRAAPAEQGVEQLRAALTPYGAWLGPTAGVVTGLIAGLVAVDSWPTVTLWANEQEFGRADAQFGRDLGWYVFALPFHALLQSWLLTTLLLCVVAATATHYVFGGVRPQSQAPRITARANVHLSVLLAALVAVRAWGFALDQYLLSYSERGVVTGLSYTDVNAQLPAYRLLLLISVVCVVLFLANIRFRGWLLPTTAVGVLVVAGVVLAGVIPAVVQRLRVEPQELERERPYIAANLDATRFAYGVDQVDTQRFPADSTLSSSQIAANTETLASVRLWDPAIAQTAYEQLQELRQYYEFADVDVDRYEIDGEMTQVLVSARELSATDIPSGTWQNRALVYTHGYGLVASAVSSATADGQPVFLARNIPTQGEPALVPEQPRLYFGESQPGYSVVRTRQPELDYSTQEGTPARNVYDGRDGVGVGSFLRRMAFAARFGELNLVLSDLLTEDSRVLFRRDVRERVHAVAPFLKLDHDTYPAIVDGRVVWILDAYTTTGMIPYSQRVDLAQLTRVDQRVIRPEVDAQGRPVLRETIEERPGLTGEVNYIRNSVKAVVDAYDGTVTLYVVDAQDPLIRAWSQAFPELFTDGGEAAAALRSHFRYPEDMFRVQSEIYRRYHIPEAEAFYEQEDAWRIPVDPSFERNQPALPRRPLRPLYQLLRLPGETTAEFALLQPYTPAGENRRNMIGYLAARSEPERYGELKAYLMPPTRTVFGPEQILSRIDAESEVAREITLLGQVGSGVVYGNVLTIPVADSLLYAVGLFVRSDRAPLPVLEKVVIVFGDQIVLRDTLAEGLEAVFGVAAPAGAPGGPPPASPPAASTQDRIAELVNLALAAFNEADEALRAGDLARYQQLVEQAREHLAEAQQLLGTTAPPTPVPSPTP